MKIIDKTPFYKENGELSMIDRGRAIIQFGPGWFKEIEGQKSVIAVLDKVLDKKYTLLRNTTPPGLDAVIPLILVGPTGVFVMSVTPVIGTMRAKGDQWGTITGNSFQAEKVNLLTRTERMARAIQVFLSRQGYSDLNEIEAALLCSDPTLHVDSMRPIIRVVMRDALERFAISVTQARTILSAETVADIVRRLQVAPAPEPAPSEPGVPAALENDPNNPYAPDPVAPESEPAPAFPEENPPIWQQPDQTAKPVRRKPALTRNQIILLVVMFVIWCIIIAVFAFLIYKDFNAI